MKEDVYKKLKGGLIVSCQALESEPLHSSFIMSRMAKAAEESGARGIRANSIVDIQAIRDVVALPMIGIIKKVYADSSVFITPTYKEVQQVCATGVEIVAMDGTVRDRPNGERLKNIVKQAKEEFPNTILMADSATLEDVKYAEEIGFDVIGTTLYGYTENTEGKNIADLDFQHLKEIIAATNLPVIAEGKVDTPEKAKRVIELGCLCAVSGGAITRPQEIAEKFVRAVESIGNE